MLDLGNIPAGTMIGDYRIEKVIGAGNMGTVYKALQLSLNRAVAVKFLGNEVFNDSPELMGYFFNEIRATASVLHQHIVKAIDVGQIEEGLFFVMEFAGGGCFGEILDRGEIPELGFVVQSMADVASALAYGFNKHHLHHGDIKPDNIMFTEEGVSKLADFGLAQTKHSHAEDSTIFVTPLYASPESLNSKVQPGNQFPDIYSFGCTLFHLLSGRTPFVSNDIDEICEMQRSVLPPKLEDVVEGLPEDLYRLVNSMLKKDPAQRPHSWEEISGRLYALLEGHSAYKPQNKGHKFHVAASYQSKLKVANVYRNKKKTNGTSFRALFMALLVIGAIAAAGYAIYKRKSIKSYLDFQIVNEVVPTYKDPSLACEYIERYLRKYKEEAMPEAHELLKEYKSKMDEPTLKE